MSREVVRNAGKSPASTTVRLLGLVGMLASFAACADGFSRAKASDASTVQHGDAAAVDDGAPPDGSAARGVPAGCSLVEATPTSSVACRADWSCPGFGVYSLTCDQPDGGGVYCYCRLDRDLQRSGAIESCGTGIDGLTAIAGQLCDWTFLWQPSDGGGTQ